MDRRISATSCSPSLGRRQQSIEILSEGQEEAATSAFHHAAAEIALRSSGDQFRNLLLGLSCLFALSLFQASIVFEHRQD